MAPEKVRIGNPAAHGRVAGVPTSQGLSFGMAQPVRKGTSNDLAAAWTPGPWSGSGDPVI